MAKFEFFYDNGSHMTLNADTLADAKEWFSSHVHFPVQKVETIIPDDIPVVTEEKKENRKRTRKKRDNTEKETEHDSNDTHEQIPDVKKKRGRKKKEKSENYELSEEEIAASITLSEQLYGKSEDYLCVATESITERKARLEAEARLELQQAAERVKSILKQGMYDGHMIIMEENKTA